MILEINKLVLLPILLLAVMSDVKYRKIPNKLTFTVMLWGVISGGIFSGFNGILFCLGGFLVGLAIFFVPFSMGGMGAGDVKLMAAIGSLIGWELTVYSALLTAIAGGIIVIGYTIYKGYFITMLKNICISIYKKKLYFEYLVTNNEKIMLKYKSLSEKKADFEKMYIPYALAITLGTILVLAGNYFGYAPFI